MADATDSALRTELRTPAVTGRAPGPAGLPLVASAGTVDGDWHRVGFVWDGTNKVLYRDDVEVARDTADALEPAAGGLRIGVGSTFAAGTFWAGLIDDVRIYGQAVQPQH